MKIVAGLLSVAMLGAMAVGCGGDDDEQGFSDAEIAAFDARFANPDGTLSGGNVAGVIRGAQDNQSSMAGANVTGNSQATGGSTGGGTITKKSGDLSPLASNGSYCNALVSGQTQGSCECPNGGSFAYEIRGAGAGGGQSNTLMRIKMNACSSGSSVIDGSEYLSMQSDASDQRNPKFSMLFVIDATITSEGKTKKVDAQMRYSNGMSEIAVRVDDGWVIVGTKSSGGTVTYTVRDRNGSWTCVYDGKGGSCTSSKGEKVSWGG